MGTFRAKEKITAKPQQVVDWTFAERAPLIIERDLIPPALKDEPQTQRDRGTDLNNVARQDLTPQVVLRLALTQPEPYSTTNAGLFSAVET